KISDVIKNYPNLYPKQFVTILIVGEKSGTLTDSFKYLAEFYLKEVRSKTKNLPVIIEPLLLIFMALIVCLVAFAIVLPIYQLTLFVSS
ncbi:MAG: type II secretion system F family protein, partial [Patescibacteria group bacterium]